MSFLSPLFDTDPEAPALVGEGGFLTRGEVARRARNVARELRARGVARGDVVALRGDVSEGLVVALHGLWTGGAVAAPLNPRWSPVEESRALELLTPDLVLDPGPETGRAGKGGGLPDPEPGRDPHPERPATAALHAPAARLLTSGTSGTPRLVTLTVGNLRASARGARERLGLSAGDRWLASLSPAHVGGLALVSRAGLLGSVLVLRGAFRAGAFLELALAGEVTHASLVPTMLRRLLEAGGGDPAPEALACLLVGGAPSPPELLEEALARGFPVAPTYGLTEASSQVATAPPGLARRKPGTVGSPLPGVRVRIDETGEILVAGSTVAPGAPGEDGWLRTGDLGRLDGEGHLRVTGRLTDRIISGGENVDPAEVEGTLRDHPGVGDAAVVGLPHPEWGEEVVAAVVPKERGALSIRDLADFCRERLSPAKRPRDLLALEGLPLNPNGKVDRAALRATFDRRRPDR